MRASLRDDLRRAAATAALLIASAPLAHAATLAGSIARWVPTATATGAAPAGQPVSIVVHMALKDQPDLAALALAVSTPGSASYGQFLSPTAFAARFAPASSDVSAVVALLKNAGMSSVTVGPLGAYVSATATVGQLRTTFDVRQTMFRFAGLTLRANTDAPTIPAALAGKILSIEGLDDTTLLKQPQHRSVTQGKLVAPAFYNAATATPSASSLLAPPVAAYIPSPYSSTYFGENNAKLSTQPVPYARTLPWLNCGYTPQQIQTAYGLNPLQLGLDGHGVTVAIIDAYASPTLEQDGNLYAARHGLPPLTGANFSEVVPAGIYDVSASEACGPYGWWTEESLDVASVHGSAPGAKIVYVGSRDCGSSLTTALLDTIYQHRADVITNSYGDNGEDVSASDVATEDQAFQAAAVMGITVLFSSGDDGDLSQDNGVASGSWEATSAYVTGVGGTSLLLKDELGNKSEYGWGTYRDFLANAEVESAKSVRTTGLTMTSANGETFPAFGFYSGSGGGISQLEVQPAYQAGIVPAVLATTLNLATGATETLSPHRVSPDIAADADPYTGYLYGESYTIANDGHSDIGCTAESATTEYCEIAEGGTSLASPLTAGTIATLDQIRGLTGRPYVGFANPWLYKSKIGKTPNSSGINQIKPPTSPTAVLRGYVTDPTEVRVVTIDSVPLLYETSPAPLQICGSVVCEGIDDVFNFNTTGYNDVTGLGVPFLPLLAFE